MKVSRISCEICGCEYGLVEVYACACDKESPSATLCEKCKKKYFDYMLPGPGISPFPMLPGPGISPFPMSPNIPSVTYIPWLRYAENLVYAYNVRFGDHQEMKKEETTMRITYKGYTGELVKLEQKKIGIADEISVYDLSIHDEEKNVIHSFTGVKLDDVNFLSRAVSFGG